MLAEFTMGCTKNGLPASRSLLSMSSSTCLDEGLATARGVTQPASTCSGIKAQHSTAQYSTAHQDGMAQHVSTSASRYGQLFASTAAMLKLLSPLTTLSQMPYKFWQYCTTASNSKGSHPVPHSHITISLPTLANLRRSSQQLVYDI